MSKESTEKHQILQAGDEFDEPGAEQIQIWLEFLGDRNNLRPGLPDLTVFFGDGRFCFY
jgi:hypothetical protein